MSAQSPLALPEGVFASLQNVRLDDAIIRARGGSQQVYTAGTNGFPSSGVMQGAFTGTIDGNVWHFVAISTSTTLGTSGALQIWATPDSATIASAVYSGSSAVNWAAGTWYEITASNQGNHGNPYGTLRMTYTGIPTRFQIIHDPSFNGGTPHDVLVIQSGSDAPRVWGVPGLMGTPISAWASTAYFMATIEQPPQPPTTATYGQLQSLACYPYAMSMAIASHSVTGSSFTYATDPVWNVSKTPTAGDTCTYVNATSVNLSAANLIVLFLDSPDSNVWNNIKIALGDGTNSVTVWDPTSATSTIDIATVTTPDVNSVTGAHMNLMQGTISMPLSWGSVASNAITTITFTWLNTVSSTNPLWSSASTTAAQMQAAGYTVTTGTQATGQAIVTNGGYGYLENNPPLVTMPTTSGSVATAKAVVQNGSVVAVDVTYGGTSYTTGANFIIGQPASQYFINIVGLCGSAGVLGGTQWAISYAASGTRTVGPRRIIAENGLGATLANMGVGGEYFSIQIPVLGTNYYGYILNWQPPTSSMAAMGIDQLLVFSQQPGQTDFYYTNQHSSGTGAPPAQWTWNGGAWTGGSTVSILLVPAGTWPILQDTNFNAPNEETICIPTGTAMADANSRFFVASSSNGPAINTVYYSDFNLPFRFRYLLQYDGGGNLIDTSGGSYIKSGEVIQTIVPIGAVPAQLNILGQPIAASGMVYVITDKNVYLTSGFDALSLNKTIPFMKYGTLSPMSVGIGQTFFYFLGNDGQVKRIEGWQSEDITAETVDNLTQNIPTSRLLWVWGACANLRYFMSCSQISGGSQTANKNVLVYSERRGKWESFDVLPSAYTSEMMLADFPAGQTRLLCYSSLSSVPGVFTYDDQSQSEDVGSAGIAIAVVGEEISMGGGVSVIAGPMGVMADIYAGGSLTTKRILACGYGDPTNQSGTIPLTASSVPEYASPSRVVRFDNAGTGTEDVSVQCQITGTVPANWKLYEAWIDTEVGVIKADRVS